MTKYAEKYNKVIEIPEMDEAQEMIVRAWMREGELRYRDSLLSVLRRVKELLEEDGNKAPKISLESVISIVENTDNDIEYR